MATPQLNLPDHIKTAAQERATDAGYASIDDYIAVLIEVDTLAESATDADLLDGLDSGPLVEITPEFLANLKNRARRK